MWNFRRLKAIAEICNGSKKSYRCRIMRGQRLITLSQNRRGGCPREQSLMLRRETPWLSIQCQSSPYTRYSPRPAERNGLLLFLSRHKLDRSSEGQKPESFPYLDTQHKADSVAVSLPVFYPPGSKRSPSAKLCLSRGVESMIFNCQMLWG